MFDKRFQCDEVATDFVRVNAERADGDVRIEVVEAGKESVVYLQSVEKVDKVIKALKKAKREAFDED